MTSRVLAVVLAAASAAFVVAQGKPAKSLEIWVVDTEGGKAALYVTPDGQTLLVDSGFPGARDTDRIMAALEDAGVKRLDYMLSTHYHVDHIGGVQELAKRIPIANYVDHGPTVEGPVTSLREQVPGFQDAYAVLHGKAKRIVVKPGDRVPITGVDWRIVTSAGTTLKTPPLAGGGKPNPACQGFTPPEDKSNLRDPDDAQSVGSVIILGQFRAIDLGDLWWTKEMELMCPTNPIGSVDLYFATSHGADASGSLPLVHGLRPRVALMQNGMRKGGAVAAMQTMRSAPGLEDIWQMHWTHNGGIEQNSAGLYIANIDDAETIAGVLTAPPRGTGPAPAGRGRGNAAHAPAYWLRVSAQADGTFTITNSRNGFSKTYKARSTAR